MSQPPVVQVTITPQSIVWALLAVLVVGLLFYLRDLVFIVLTAIVIASAIEPAARFLSRRGIPRVLSVLGIYLLLSASLFVLFYFFLPPLLREGKDFLVNLPSYAGAFGIDTEVVSTETLLGRAGSFGFEQFHLSETIAELHATLSGAAQQGFGLITAFFGGIISFTLILVLSFYFAVQETGIDDFIRLIVPSKNADYAVSLWRRAQDKMGRWLQGQVLLSLLVGVLIAVGLSLFGVRHALLLGILAALLELVPIFGSIFAAIPALAIALIDGGLSLMLVVLALYVFVNQFESHVVYPLVVRKIVNIPPVLIIIALVAGAQLGGMFGIILSIPIAAAVREFISDTQKNRRELAGQAS